MSDEVIVTAVLAAGGVWACRLSWRFLTCRTIGGRRLSLIDLVHTWLIERGRRKTLIALVLVMMPEDVLIEERADGTRTQIWASSGRARASVGGIEKRGRNKPRSKRRMS